MSTVQEVEFNANLLAAILWQYEDSSRLKAIISAKQEWFNANHADFWSNWYRDVFNIDTATKFGLSIWGRILNVPLGVDTEPQPEKFSFGFGIHHANFGRGNFGRNGSGTQSLSLEQQRLVIRMRYFQLTCRATVPEINEFLADMFSDQGPAYVIDNLDMSMTYVFGFAISSELKFIFENYSLLPRSSTVQVSWVSYSRDSFGFGPFNLNFNNGNFGD